MNRRVLAVLALSTLVVPGVQAATGTPQVAAAIQLSELRGTPLVSSLGGWNQDFAAAHLFSSAAVADVTGDGQVEVIVGGMNSIARVYDLANSRVIELNPGGANAQTGHGATQASPAIADMNGDGVDDVVIANTGGRIAAYSVRNGVANQLYNHFVEPAFHNALVGAFGTPAIGYVDKDPQLDVVTSSWGQTVDVWSGPTGQHLPQNRQWVRDTIWSSPVIGDVDGDGANEIVVGADCDGSGTPQPCYGIGHGGYVWAFNLDGSVQWSHFVRGAVVWSTPALIDLNGDGARDVVVGTGLYFLGPEANQVMALDGKTGQPIWSAPTGGPVLGSPSVAVVNGQPRIWVVSGGGMLMSWNGAGGLLWQQCVVDGACSASAATHGGVSIADINNDGALDAVVQGEQQLKVFDAMSGAPQASVRSSYGQTLFASYGTPTVASVNGRTWIVQVNIGDANRNLQRDGYDDLVVSIWTTGTPLGAAPWPTFKANMARTGGPLPVPPEPPVAPGGRLCTAVAGTPGDAAVMNLTPVEAAGAGNGLLISSDVTQPPVASNVNFGPNTVDPNVAIAPIGRDNKVCYVNSTHSWVHLVADHLGTIKAKDYVPATTSGAPDRKIDTRIGQGGGMIPPGGRLCAAVAGSPGDAAVMNLTPIEAGGPGNGLLVSSAVTEPPVASNVNFGLNTVDPNVAIAPIGPGNAVCYVNSAHSWVHLVADHLGTIRAGAYVAATPTGAPDRKIDTRIGHGGGLVAPGARLCAAVNGAPGDAAVMNLTPVEAHGFGNGLLISSSVANPPVASNVNFGPNTVDPNVAIARIGADNTVCFVNSTHSSVHLVADHLGTIKGDAYVPATQSGAPDRKIDTRIGLVPR